MQLKYFTVQFKSPSAKRVYLVGNTVEGVVRIGFEKPTEMKCKFFFYGGHLGFSIDTRNRHLVTIKGMFQLSLLSNKSVF
jgi:hypothetical protein